MDNLVDNERIILITKEGFYEDAIDSLILYTTHKTFSLTYGGPMVVYDDYFGYYELTDTILKLYFTGYNVCGENRSVYFKNRKEFTLKYWIYYQPTTHNNGYYKETTFYKVCFNRSPFKFLENPQGPCDKVYYCNKNSTKSKSSSSNTIKNIYKFDNKLIPSHLQTYCSDITLDNSLVTKFKDYLKTNNFNYLQKYHIAGISNNHILLYHNKLTVLITPNNITTHFLDTYTFDYNDKTIISSLSDIKEQKTLDDIKTLKNTIFIS